MHKAFLSRACFIFYSYFLGRPDASGAVPVGWPFAAHPFRTGADPGSQCGSEIPLLEVRQQTLGTTGTSCPLPHLFCPDGPNLLHGCAVSPPSRLARALLEEVSGTLGGATHCPKPLGDISNEILPRGARSLGIASSPSQTPRRCGHKCRGAGERLVAKPP